MVYAASDGRSPPTRDMHRLPRARSINEHGLTADATMPPKRPNIVFAFADDWGRYASAYAPHEWGSANHSLNELISTPHFDRSR